ncbi:MAG: inositol monophosphatase family protein [Thermoanaerobaculia bacterium]
MNEDLQLALSMADESDVVTMRHFLSPSLVVRKKADRTPVSEVDEAVERMIRAHLKRERPHDAIVGEEFGAGAPADRRWIVDPIDATKNYIRGIPVFATLIALEQHGALRVGVVSAPALHQRWWASAGEGAFCNGRRITVSRVAELEHAQLCYDSVEDFDQFGLTDSFLALARQCARSRAFGDFWSHMLVAEGAAEIAIEPAVSVWDMAAIQIIVEEAGGRFTDLTGAERADGGSGMSTNGLLHDAALSLVHR